MILILFIKRIFSPIINIKLTSILNYIVFFKNLIKYYRLGGKARIINFYPCLYDNTDTIKIDSHYLYQNIWAFDKIRNSGINNHMDIGSLSSFVAFLTVLTRVTYVDIRPLKLNTDNYNVIAGSILNLPFKNNSIYSLSCLHVVEHIGLGRYGDKIDPYGSKKACKEIQRILGKNGNLYFSLPIGKPKTFFNAHRIHTVEQILDYFPGLILKNLSVVNDQGIYIKNVEMDGLDNYDYSCGMFHFYKE
jgi:SAM-dependent methyltransferase